MELRISYRSIHIKSITSKLSVNPGFHIDDNRNASDHNIETLTERTMNRFGTKYR